MNIEITESQSHEIIQILSSFPRGRLVIKKDRIFWDSVSLEPVPRPNEAAKNYDQRQPQMGPQKDDIGKRFKRMADTLGSMVC